jgi:hypothetical protein
MSKYCLSLLLGFLGAGWFFLGDAHAADGMQRRWGQALIVA